MKVRDFNVSLGPQFGSHAQPRQSSLHAREEERALVSRSISADLSLKDALDIYIELRSDLPNSGSYVSDHTQRMDRNHRESLLLFFGGSLLRDIHWQELRAYQKARGAGAGCFVRFRRPQDAKPTVRNGEIIAPPKGKTPCPVKSQQINQELGTLRRILWYAGCWDPDDQKYFKNLTPEEDGAPRALTPEEQGIWLETSRDHWETVHWWSTAAIDACMGTNEMDGLRIGDLNLHHQVVTVPWPCAKNRNRKRTIVIESAEALWAWDRLLARAYDLGARSPLHYLFPFGPRGAGMSSDKRKAKYDPSRHATGSWLKRQWQEVRTAAITQDPFTGEELPLDWVDRYSMRHTGATRRAEDGVPIDVIMSRLGHATEEMRQHYTQISLSAQRRWMQYSQPFAPRIPPRNERLYPSPYPVQNFFKKTS